MCSCAFCAPCAQVVKTVALPAGLKAVTDGPLLACHRYVYALCDRDADKKEAKEGKLSDGGKTTDAKAEAKAAGQSEAVLLLAVPCPPPCT